MENSLLLRKGTVVEIISREEFLIEDVMNREIINMTIPKKFRINYFKVEIGEIVYVIVSPSEKTKGRITLLSSFKRNQNLSRQKAEIDKKHNESKS